MLLARLRRRRCTGIRCGARFDPHAGFDDGHAGALAGAAIDRDPAIEADANAAIQTARGALYCLSQGEMSRCGKRCGDRFSFQRRDGAPIEQYFDRRTGTLDALPSKAQRASSGIVQHEWSRTYSDRAIRLPRGSARKLRDASDGECNRSSVGVTSMQSCETGRWQQAEKRCIISICRFTGRRRCTTQPSESPQESLRW